MRGLVPISFSLFLAACATTAEEKPLSAAEREAVLASLSPADRDAFELLLWAREVDPKPIAAQFKACIDPRVEGGFETQPALLANEALDTCFPIIEPWIRGAAMGVPALATGVTGNDLNSWADVQASEQREEMLVALTKRIEASRTQRADK